MFAIILFISFDEIADKDKKVEFQADFRPFMQYSGSFQAV